MFDFDRYDEEYLRQRFEELHGSVQETLFALIFAVSAFLVCLICSVTSTEPFAVLLIPLLLVGSFEISKLLSPKAQSLIDRYLYCREKAMNKHSNSLPSWLCYLKPLTLASIGFLIALSLFVFGIFFNMDIF